ncbi:MAG: hypothetical protein U0V56_10960 [Actinomycetota bacterium]
MSGISTELTSGATACNVRHVDDRGVGFVGDDLGDDRGVVLLVRDDVGEDHVADPSRIERLARVVTHGHTFGG